MVRGIDVEPSERIEWILLKAVSLPDLLGPSAVDIDCPLGKNASTPPTSATTKLISGNRSSTRP